MLMLLLLLVVALYEGIHREGTRENLMTETAKKKKTIKKVRDGLR